MKNIPAASAALVAVLLFSVPAGAARTPAGPVAKELAGKRIQCRVAAASRFKNGTLESSLDPARSTFKTCNQYGGKEYDDAMCFTVHMLTPDGQESALGFGCIPLTDVMVRHFDGRSLRLHRREYNETIDINFANGSGRISYDTRGCDWGRRCVHATGEAEMLDCVILDEPAKSCAGLKE